MAVKNYGLLKGKVIESRMERDLDTPHYQIHVVDENSVHYRIAVNVMSSSEDSEVLYLVNENFASSLTEKLAQLPESYLALGDENRELAIDYIRDGLFEPSLMTPLPSDATGPDNDLNDMLDKYVQRAISEKALIYVYGSKFGPESQPDKVFGFQPTNGMHNIHMNQGNEDKPNERDWADDNGTWHDGSLFLQFEDQWTAIFLAFLSQSWCTDERGYPTRMCRHDDKIQTSS
ncbi:YukJ family protein [Fictibacillus terranigra]|uniref:YukJ family protein n=1 Tax=Fictibacillus terranigra TaxID=3058424 RepID=A0ABT8E5H0_9BACL|nr:YukJ family protein [Fictibacillus sp. CENA-BCM004]MDN4073150.1 YukJ family protein [Fictibacillus sp. CENA-BCM004]